MRNAVNALLAHPVWQTFGWTLLHFVWQGALVALLYAAAAVSLRRASANTRYLAACACMFLMLALPVATFLQLDSNAPARVFNRRTQEAAPAARADASGAERTQAGAPARLYANFLIVPGDEGASAPLLKRWAEDRFTSALPWLVLLWLAGALALALRLAGGWVLAGRLKREPATVPLARDWRETLARLARQLRVSRPIGLCESALVEVPTVVGWLRPVILFPASALTGLSAPQLEALLAHELAHIRRHDYLVNLLQSVVEIVLFYHPAVWWLSGRVRIEREHACDDLAVGATGDVLVYARALTALETLRGQSSGARALVVAADGGILMQRIQRLLKAQPAKAGARSPLVAGAGCVLLVLAGVIACAQTFNSLQAQETRAARKAPALNSTRVKRRVAVTFVSLPAVYTFYNPRAEKDTRRLLSTLASNDISAVGFVNENQLYDEEAGGRLDEERVRLLNLWLDAGHELGTQTRAHSNLYKTPLAQFQQDVIRGEEVTARLMSESGRGRPRYFSYPYLNVGGTRETKEAAEAFLAARGYRIHQVTIDNMDWLFGRVYAQARRAEDEATMRRVADEYVPYMERMFEYYEELSRTTLGYELPQVLMLTAHALNAHKMEDLVAMLKRRGYEFVTLEEALDDKAYRREAANYTGPWGISWLERWALERGHALGGEPDIPPFMRQFDVSRGGTDYTKLYKVKN